MWRVGTNMLPNGVRLEVRSQATRNPCKSSACVASFNPLPAMRGWLIISCYRQGNGASERERTTFPKAHGYHVS